MTGVDIPDPKESRKIWEQYVETFKKGEFNLIRDEADPVTHEIVARKYVSGGIPYYQAEKIVKFTSDMGALSPQFSLQIVHVRVDMAETATMTENGISKISTSEAFTPLFITKAVFSSRLALINLSNSRDLRWGLTADALNTKCALSSADLERRILGFSKPSDRLIVHRHQVVRILQSLGIDQRNGHGFLVVSTVDRHYLADLTYLMHFAFRRKDDVRNPAYILDLMVKNGKPQWADLARQFSRDGVMALTDDLADMYLTSFSGTSAHEKGIDIPNRRVFTKDDLIGKESTFRNVMPEMMLEGLMGPLENDNGSISPLLVNKAVESALDDSLLPGIKKNAETAVGGIDLKSAEHMFQRNGSDQLVKMPTGMKAVDENNIAGVSPVITGGEPLNDIQRFLGTN